MVTIQIKKLSDAAKIPTRGSDFAAGYDLYSIEGYVLKPLERKLFKTNLSLAIPSGLYGRIAPRSGLAFKDGIDTLAGVIDEDYRGDVGVILINLGSVDKEIKVGDKIAQIIFENYTPATFAETTELLASKRAEGGFGSTDKTPLAAITESKVIATTPIKHENTIGKTLADIYQSVGGVQTKKRYIDEVKERDSK